MPPQNRLSLFSRHYMRWHQGCGSETCSRATNVCIARGTVPCDILFIGEAPGTSENDVGRPLVGIAGRYLDDNIVSRAVPPTMRCAYTNLVGCMPTEQDGRKSGEPDHDDILTCQPRLIEFVNLCDPRLIVCVGSNSRDYLDPKVRWRPRFDKLTYWLDIIPHDVQLPAFDHTYFPEEGIPKEEWSRIPGRIPMVDIVHPSHILQSNMAMRSLAVRKCIVTIESALRRIGLV